MNRFHAFNIRAKIVARPTPPIAAGMARSFSTLSAHKLGHDPRRHRRNRRPGWARHIGNLFQPDERGGWRQRRGLCRGFRKQQDP